MRVELKNVGKRFGAFTALRDVELDLASGSRTALVGPNGSGKSTLVRLLMGMLGGAGEVRLDGRDPIADRDALARRVAYVPQIAPRLWAPVREVVAAVARLRGIDRDRVAELARRLELDLAAIAARPFRALSGGMRQKVLAALALAADTELLLLDEPTASMDPHSRATFFQLLDELKHRPTILLCSHRIEEIRRQVENVAVMADGRLTWFGPARRFLAESTQAVVEIVADSPAAIVWLEQRGFVATRTGWWSRAVPAAERAGLVRQVVHELNGAVVDVLARDQERTDLGPTAAEEQQ